MHRWMIRSKNRKLNLRLKNKTIVVLYLGYICARLYDTPFAFKCIICFDQVSQELCHLLTLEFVPLLMIEFRLCYFLTRFLKEPARASIRSPLRCVSHPAGCFPCPSLSRTCRPLQGIAGLWPFRTASPRWTPPYPGSACTHTDEKGIRT